METKSASVPSPATQVEEAASRWDWVEPSVWTERMLTALAEGVKGGVWFTLMDKVFSERNLRAAATKVIANRGAAGVDHVSVEQFAKELDAQLAELRQQLPAGTYRPRAVRRVQIPKPGSRATRPLGIPTVRDRVVQGAVRHVLEPIFERDFAEQSYGFRPGRSCKDALRRVDQLLKAGYQYVVDADLKSYFDTIPHDRLLERVRRRIADGKLLSLIEAFLKAEVFDGLRQWEPERGAPQGAVLSPLLSNIYLDDLDHLLASQGLEMVRYADDFVILCRTMEEAQAALDLVQAWTRAAGLMLHPEKTRLVDAMSTGFEFLGYRFIKHRRYPRQKSVAKFRDALRAKTTRANGQSLSWIIADVNRTLKGWFLYFQHSHRTALLAQDQWVRRRLRSILRKRRGLRGMSRGGADHQRWDNAFFAERGLYSLFAAHASVVQSLMR